LGLRYATVVIIVRRLPHSPPRLIGPTRLSLSLCRVAQARSAAPSPRLQRGGALRSRKRKSGHPTP
jgi:hypothetical protein